MPQGGTTNTPARGSTSSPPHLPAKLGPSLASEFKSPASSSPTDILDLAQLTLSPTVRDVHVWLSELVPFDFTADSLPNRELGMLAVKLGELLHQDRPELRVTLVERVGTGFRELMPRPPAGSALSVDERSIGWLCTHASDTGRKYSSERQLEARRNAVLRKFLGIKAIYASTLETFLQRWFHHLLPELEALADSKSSWLLQLLTVHTSVRASVWERKFREISPKNQVLTRLFLAILIRFTHLALSDINGYLSTHMRNPLARGPASPSVKAPAAREAGFAYEDDMEVLLELETRAAELRQQLEEEAKLAESQPPPPHPQPQAAQRAPRARKVRHTSESDCSSDEAEGSEYDRYSEDPYGEAGSFLTPDRDDVTSYANTAEWWGEEESSYQPSHATSRRSSLGPFTVRSASAGAPQPPSASSRLRPSFMPAYAREASRGPSAPPGVRFPPPAPSQAGRAGIKALPPPARNARRDSPHSAGGPRPEPLSRYHPSSAARSIAGESMSTLTAPSGSVSHYSSAVQRAHLVLGDLLYMDERSCDALPDLLRWNPADNPTLLASWVSLAKAYQREPTASSNQLWDQFAVMQSARGLLIADLSGSLYRVHREGLVSQKDLLTGSSPAQLYNPDSDLNVQMAAADVTHCNHVFPLTAASLEEFIRAMSYQAHCESRLRLLPTSHQERHLLVMDYGHRLSGTIRDRIFPPSLGEPGQHPQHISRWALFLQFHLHQWMTAVLRGDLRLLTDGSYHANLVPLDNKLAALASLEPASLHVHMSYLGYTCSSCGRLGRTAICCESAKCAARTGVLKETEGKGTSSKAGRTPVADAELQKRYDKYCTDRKAQSASVLSFTRWTAQVKLIKQSEFDALAAKPARTPAPSNYAASHHALRAFVQHQHTLGQLVWTAEAGVQLL